MERLTEQLLRWTSTGPLGILGPVLLLVLLLCLAWRDRSPVWVKALLACLLILLLLIMFGYI